MSCRSKILSGIISSTAPKLFSNISLKKPPCYRTIENIIFAISDEDKYPLGCGDYILVENRKVVAHKISCAVNDGRHPPK